MAERDIPEGRTRVALKQVVKEPGFNYRQHLRPIPDNLREYVRGLIKDKGKEARFDEEKIRGLIDEFNAAAKDDKDKITPPQRRAMVKVVNLAFNINRRGLLEPLIVRESGASADNARTYFLVAGERRLMALELAGQTTVEIKIRKGDRASLEIDRFVENVQREDTTEFEDAEAIEKFLADHKDYTQDRLAQELGKSPAWVSTRRSLGKKIIPLGRDLYEDGVINYAQLRELLGLKHEEQERILGEIKKKVDAGEKVTALDVKDKTDAAKTEQKKGKEQEKSSKGKGKAAEPEKKGGKAEPKGSKAAEVDDEDADADAEVKTYIGVAKEAGYDVKKPLVRSKREVNAMLGKLTQKKERVSSDRSKFELKGLIRALEWLRGDVENLG